MMDTSGAARATIYVGRPEDKLCRTITIPPHTCFSVEDLSMAVAEYTADTIVCCISRPLDSNPIVEKARALNLRLIAGNSHAVEILENGIPLAWAIKKQLPALNVRVFRERLASYPLARCGNKELPQYGEEMADKYLPRKA